MPKVVKRKSYSFLVICVTRKFNPFLASDWLFSYARKFSSTRVSSELRASVRTYARRLQSTRVDRYTELRASVTVSLLLIGSFLTRVAFYLRASSQSYAPRFESPRVVTRGVDPDSASYICDGPPTTDILPGKSIRQRVCEDQSRLSAPRMAPNPCICSAIKIWLIPETKKQHL